MIVMQAKGPRGTVRGEAKDTKIAAMGSAMAAYRAKFGRPAKGEVKCTVVGGGRRSSGSSGSGSRTRTRSNPAKLTAADLRGLQADFEALGPHDAMTSLGYVDVRKNGAVYAHNKKIAQLERTRSNPAPRRTRSNPARAQGDGFSVSPAERRVIELMRKASSPRRTIEQLAERWKVPVIVPDLPLQLDPAMMREGVSFVLGTDKDGVPCYLELMPSRSAARATCAGVERRGAAPARKLPKRVKYRLASRVDTHPAVYTED